MKFHKTSHLLHLILTIATSGLWAIVWIYCALSNSQKNRQSEFMRGR